MYIDIISWVRVGTGVWEAGQVSFFFVAEGGSAVFFLRGGAQGGWEAGQVSLLYMCPHTTISMCLHASVYVLILLYVCGGAQSLA